MYKCKHFPLPNFINSCIKKYSIYGSSINEDILFHYEYSHFSDKQTQHHCFLIKTQNFLQPPVHFRVFLDL